MTVDYSKIRSVTARQLASALEKDGFRLQRQKGSHRHYHHPDGRRVTLSFHHSSDTFRRGTLHSIIEIQARWSGEDVTRLGLVG
jgi:predicted RNA binding protein YcfA (HicA-like mRNA interferase family)